MTTRYEITAEYVPDNATLAGTVKVTYENATENALSALKFQLSPNAYRKDALYRPIAKTYETEAYYKGESYGEMVISSVSGAKNWEVVGEDENILTAHLIQPLFPGEKTVLDIGFLLKLAAVNHRTGVTAHTVNLGNFYPTLCGMKNGAFYETAYYSNGDPFYSDVADYKVTFTTPKDYVVASTGDVYKERSLESKREYAFTANKVRDFCIVLSKEFSVLESNVNGNTLLYYYYNDKNARETLALAGEVFTFYEDTYGAYPYTSFSFAQTGFCLGGMEYPRLAMISDKLSSQQKARVIAHELAHQWWYGVVGSDQIENAWQDEGLAEYSAVTFFEKYEKYGVTRETAVQEALREYRSYYDVYGSVLGRADTKMTRHLKEYVTDYEYKCLSYDKSLVMFDTLRKSVGDKGFFNALRRYYSTNKYKVVTPAHLFAAFEKTGYDVHGFFESFLSGKAVL